MILEYTLKWGNNSDPQWTCWAWNESCDQSRIVLMFLLWHQRQVCKTDSERKLSTLRNWARKGHPSSCSESDFNFKGAFNPMRMNVKMKLWSALACMLFFTFLDQTSVSSWEFVLKVCRWKEGSSSRFHEKGVYPVFIISSFCFLRGSLMRDWLHSKKSIFFISSWDKKKKLESKFRCNWHAWWDVWFIWLLFYSKKNCLFYLKKDAKLSKKSHPHANTQTHSKLAFLPQDTDWEGLISVSTTTLPSERFCMRWVELKDVSCVHNFLILTWVLPKSRASISVWGVVPSPPSFPEVIRLLWWQYLCITILSIKEER